MNCLIEVNNYSIPKIIVQGNPIRFKLDSGSDTSILSKSQFIALHLKSNIKVTLISFGNFRTIPLSEITLNCIYKNVIKNVQLVCTYKKYF